MTRPTCQCGCGKPVRAGSRFRPGHSQFGRAGELAPNWKGGDGRDNLHLTAYAPDNPRARRAAAGHSHVPVHILMAEKALGRFLPRGVVAWFLDGDRGNPAPGNFVICPDKAYRWLLERRKLALVATGDVHSVRCYKCGRWALPGEQNEGRTGHGKGICRRKKSRE